MLVLLRWRPLAILHSYTFLRSHIIRCFMMLRGATYVAAQGVPKAQGLLLFDKLPVAPRWRDRPER